MSWEAFLGALLPGLIAALFALAAYLKAKSVETISHANRDHLSEQDVKLTQIVDATNGVTAGVRTLKFGSMCTAVSRAAHSWVPATSPRLMQARLRAEPLPSDRFRHFRGRSSQVANRRLLLATELLTAVL